ncbi:hypothetical protein TSUD_178830 [Trifolium subterraneum]|uniref:Uncharacterized protein n=1 Tax=Trifolium subterraneum TaxID=3900 RepID=A0A2Z6P7F1_TRISU|nr:hypothetical protein TSUD_178830 [Trifolium subterraneum]
MAYRRRQGISRASTFKEEFHSSLDDPKDSDLQNGSVSSSNSSLSVQAIKASAARHQPALSFALDPDHPDYRRSTIPESNKRMDNPSIRKGLDAISSSLNQLGDTFEKAYEEGKTIVETKTADLRSQIRRKGNGPEDIYQASDQTQSPSRHETQLKASRDVAMATAAKAKLLLRELKTVKADLAFAKARSSQLEEENKLLREREGSDKGLNHNDDDLIRNQLETLLAEKSRLANENETYSRENRFLREIVEYHQLTMQDVVYLDEGMEEVTMDDNGITRVLSISPHALSPKSPDEVVLESNKVMFPVPEEDDKSTSDENETPPNVSPSQHAK